MQHFPGLLTKKFISLIKHAEDGVLDLNKAASTLEVSILSVLDQVNYLQHNYHEGFCCYRCRRGEYMTSQMSWKELDL